MRSYAGILSLLLVASLAVNSLAVQPTTSTYDYQQDAEGITKCVRLAIPSGVPVVRGILVFTNAAGGDTRDDYRQPWHEEFLYLHGFAFLGTKGFTSHVESFDVLTHALKRFVQDSSHPEVERAPFAVYGFSAGGGFASRLLNEAPERVIGAVMCSSFLRINGTPAQLRTPVCLISGELESRLGTALEGTLPEFRRQDAQYAWMTVQGFAHQWSGQRVLALPMLDAVVRRRYSADRERQLLSNEGRPGEVPTMTHSLFLGYAPRAATTLKNPEITAESGSLCLRAITGACRHGDVALAWS